MRNILIGLVIVAVAAIAFLGYRGLRPGANVASSGNATASRAAEPAATPKPVTVTADDRVMGSPDAPVTIVEYASMTCPHCAHFAIDVLPQVKATLIDTGKARLVFRD